MAEEKKKGTTEDEKVGWHHRLNGREFEQALGDGEGQGSLACCSVRGCKVSDTTEQLNNCTTTRINSRPSFTSQVDTKTNICEGSLLHGYENREKLKYHCPSSNIEACIRSIKT